MGSCINNDITVIGLPQEQSEGDGLVNWAATFAAELGYEAAKREKPINYISVLNRRTPDDPWIELHVSSTNVSLTGELMTVSAEYPDLMFFLYVTSGLNYSHIRRVFHNGKEIFNSNFYEDGDLVDQTDFPSSGSPEDIIKAGVDALGKAPAGTDMIIKMFSKVLEKIVAGRKAAEAAAVLAAGVLPDGTPF
jgi:hypothetical protein